MAVEPVCSRSRHLQAGGNCRGCSTIFANSWRLGKLALWVALTSTQKTNTAKMTYVVKILEL